MTCYYDARDKWNVCKCSLNELHTHFLPMNITLSKTNVYTMPPEEYVFRQNRKCYLKISGMSGNQWILGDSFMRNFTTIFDQENNTPRVGFAVKTKTEFPSMVFVRVSTYISLGIMILTMILALCLVLTDNYDSIRPNQIDDNYHQDQRRH